jgi:glutamyl-tRNA synthetase
VQELRAAGYLPAAVRNYLALLGWGAADDQTILSTPELVAQFTIERVSRNPARFDEQKLRWLNGRYVRDMPQTELVAALEQFTGRQGLDAAVAISSEKIQTLADFWPLSGFLFDGPVDDRAAHERWLDADGRGALAEAREALAATDPFELETVEHSLKAVVDARHAKPRDVYQPVRVALAGTAQSPGIFESLVVLGRDESLRRIDAALTA